MPALTKLMVGQLIAQGLFLFLRRIRTALDWLLPLATGDMKWSCQQIFELQPEKLAPLLRRAAVRYRVPAYEKAIGKLPKISGDERWQLLVPK